MRRERESRRVVIRREPREEVSMGFIENGRGNETTLPAGPALEPPASEV